MVAFGFRLHWLEHLALFLLARLDPMVNPAGYASSLIVVENNAASNRRRHLLLEHLEPQQQIQIIYEFHVGVMSDNPKTNL